MPPGKSVLLIDDSARQTHLLELGLRRADKRLGIFTLGTGGDAAIERMLRAPPALVVLDRSMPDADGFETLRLIRGELAALEVPVIMVSGSDDADHIAHARHVGADAYMVKPSEESLWEVFAARIASWTSRESWRARASEIVPVSCVPAAGSVRGVETATVVMMTKGRSADQKLVEFTAACDFAGITVSRCMNLRQTDKILDAKRRLVVRWLLSVPQPLPWSEWEVRDLLDFSPRYFQERRAENTLKPLAACGPRALVLE